LRVISRHQQLLRLDFQEASLPLPQPEPLDDLLQGCDVLLLSDYGRGALLEPERLVAAARARGIPVLVDPKGPDFERFTGADLLTPNRQEFEALVGTCSTEAELATRGLALIEALNLGALLITRGEQGMTLLRPGHAPLHLPARAREVFDVTGAGDTVVAIVAAALAAGSALPEAVALANLAAGLVVAQLGTAAVSVPQLRRALALEQGVERGVLGLEQLQRAVADARAQDERVVFTNGCFDILHAGHVAYLEEASALGARLIVAVNSDDSVRRIKGDGRPVNNLERRMAVLAGLESVDWVVSFDADTPEVLLRDLQPDVLVKGGDYASPQEVVGWQIVEEYGGQVRIMGRVDGVSTTATVRHIRENSKC
jgi:D-beta-D-heptose 7-phosphate kinase/D-beta-D-heptose 1-phosphate adenosyltransferase